MRYLVILALAALGGCQNVHAENVRVYVDCPVEDIAALEVDRVEVEPEAGE